MHHTLKSSTRKWFCRCQNGTFPSQYRDIQSPPPPHLHAMPCQWRPRHVLHFHYQSSGYNEISATKYILMLLPSLMQCKPGSQTVARCQGTEDQTTAEFEISGENGDQCRLSQMPDCWLTFSAKFSKGFRILKDQQWAQNAFKNISL